MQVYRKSRKGFSLVELLAVVLILAVLAAVAVPLYVSQRKSAAGRACKANLAALASAISAYAIRNGAYPSALSTLVGQPEGVASVPTCPLDGSTYSWTTSTTGASLSCPNATSHVGYGGSASTEWQRTFPALATDSIP